MRKWELVCCLSVVLVVGLYLFLRLGWWGSVEFGYDQPLLSLRVVDFLKNPTFLKSYQFVGVNPWGYPSWGPMQIFFYAPFFLLSKNPLTVSLLVAIFNSLSVLGVVYLGWQLFSPLAGVVAGLILATHPWWVVFSRMIYQPTPVPTLTVLSAIVLLKIFQGNRRWAVVGLAASWAVLLQVYIHTVSFVLISFLLMISRLRKVSVKYLTIGIGIFLAFLVPYLYYFSLLQDELFLFIGVLQKFARGEVTIVSSLGETILVWMQTLAGVGFEWQLGYGAGQFANLLIGSKFAKAGLLSLVVIVSGVNLLRIRKRKERLFSLFILLWAILPVLFLIIIRTPIALPRYFLISLPAYALLFARVVDHLVKKKTFVVKWGAVLLTSIVALWNIYFVVNYHSFIINFNYPKGFLSYYSDIPFNFLDQALGFIYRDAKIKGYSRITISQDIDSPKEETLSPAARYLLEYVHQPFQGTVKEERLGYYLLISTPIPDYVGRHRFKQFGPYMIFDWSEVNQ